MASKILFSGLEKVVRGKKGSREEVSVSSLDGEGKVIGLYFSAHWCPPCRGFTPQLAKWYTELKKKGDLAEKFDIVFLSSDKDEEAFDSYFDEMPWLALPFSQKELKQKVSSKYKVSGIPTLLMFDAKTGDLINKGGRGVVTEDPKGEKFPWREPTLQERLSSVALVNKKGEKKSFSDIDGKPFGLYFSAHWCPPCRTFTPKLAEFYSSCKEDFEIIFVSGDKDESQFKEYLNEMPWVAVPYDSEDVRDKLNEIFEVQGIPHLVIFDGNCKVTTDSGRSMVEKDPQGNDFPWGPKALDSLHSGTAGAINDHPCVVYITDGSEAQVKKAEEQMKPIAEPYFEEHKGSDDSMCFLYTVGDELSSRLAQFLQISEPFPKLIIVDIPNGKKYICEDENMASFVKKFQNGSLTSKGLKE